MKSALLATFLLLGIVYRVFSIECPLQEDIRHCQCKVEGGDMSILCTFAQFEISMVELKRILHVFDKRATLSLTLDYMKLDTVASDFFSGLNIRELYISYCGLDALTEEGGRALSGLEDTLEKLHIISSFKEENIPARLDVSHLRRLRDLTLESNTISELGDGWFENGPPQLKQLILEDNGFMKLGQNVFWNLTGVGLLVLKGNRFGGTMQRKMLPSPGNKLEYLELSNNALTRLSEDFLTDLPLLTELDLRENGLLLLEQKIAQPVWRQINRIGLEDNPLACDDSSIGWMIETVGKKYRPKVTVGRKCRPKATVGGKCQFPPERKDMLLDDLIKGKVQ